MGLHEEPEPEVSVLLCDDETIHALNLEWRGVDAPTDVLSFPLWEPDDDLTNVPALGDIIISIPYAERLLSGETHRTRVAAELGVEAETLEWSLLDEVFFLYIHGLLHLVGHDHMEPDEEAEMMAEERRLWLDAQ